MTTGGKRDGAGRPKGAPTKAVRVLERAAQAAPALAAYFLDVADRAFRDHYRQTIITKQFEPMIRLIGIEEVEVVSAMSAGTLTVLVGEAEMGGIRSVFSVELTGYGFHSRSETEI